MPMIVGFFSAFALGLVLINIIGFVPGVLLSTLIGVALAYGVREVERRTRD